MNGMKFWALRVVRGIRQVEIHIPTVTDFQVISNVSESAPPAGDANFAFDIRAGQSVKDDITVRPL